jgi:hypothetical protein
MHSAKDSQAISFGAAVFYRRRPRRNPPVGRSDKSMRFCPGVEATRPPTTRLSLPEIPRGVGGRGSRFSSSAMTAARAPGEPDGSVKAGGHPATSLAGGLDQGNALAGCDRTLCACARRDPNCTAPLSGRAQHDVHADCVEGRDILRRTHALRVAICRPGGHRWRRAPERATTRPAGPLPFTLFARRNDALEKPWGGLVET